MPADTADRVHRAPATGRSVPTDAPDALLIDLMVVTDADPLRLCRETVRTSPATSVVGVGPADRLADGFQMLRLGAVAWFDDSATATAAIGHVLLGESMVAPRHAAWILADFDAIAAQHPVSDPRFRATATEREVLTRLAKGETVESIAAFHDVDAHVVKRQTRLALSRLQRHR